MADYELDSLTDFEVDSELRRLVEFAIAQRQEECEQLGILCKELANIQSECLFVSHFEIKNHGSFENDRKELVIKSDSKVLQNMWKLSLLAAFQKNNLLPSSIDIKESCISLTLDQDDFEKVIEFLHPLAQKMQCLKDNVNDYFSSLDPPTEDNLQQVLNSVIEIQSEWTAHVIACWDSLKIDEFLAADSIGISIGGMREDQGLYEISLESPSKEKSKETFFWSTCVNSLLKMLNIVEFSIDENIGQHSSVTVNEENYEKLLQALKPLSLRFRFGEVSLFGVSPVIINHASELITSGSAHEVSLIDKKNSQFKPWLDFVRKVQPRSVYFWRLGDQREAEDFLFPLASLVEVIKINDAEGPIDPPVPMSTLKEILSRKCSRLILEHAILSLEEAEKFAQLFNHLSKVCYLRMSTDADEFDANVGEYIISSFTSQYDGAKMDIFSPSQYCVR